MERKMEIKMLGIEQIEPGPFQLRESIDDEKLKELIDSVQEMGTLEPIHVRKHGKSYQIISGERRWRAAKKLGLEEIPAIIKDADERILMIESLIHACSVKQPIVPSTSLV